MKTASEIYMDFVKAHKQATGLRSLAKELRRLKNGDMADCVSRISGHWQGENAEAFIKKCNHVSDDMENSARALERAAGTIDSIAGRTYKAEMEALQLAQQR